MGKRQPLKAKIDLEFLETDETEKYKVKSSKQSLFLNVCAHVCVCVYYEN